MSSSYGRGPKSLGLNHGWGSNCLSGGNGWWAETLRRRHWWRSQLMQRVHVLERLLGMAEETERRLQHGLWACGHQGQIHTTVRHEQILQIKDYLERNQ